MSNVDATELVKRELHRMLERSHPAYADPYEPRGTAGQLPRGSSRTFTEIAPITHPGRIGQPVRLAKAEHRINMGAGHTIHPGQVCVAVESRGIGQGSIFDGIHAVRARLPSETERRMHVARVQVVPGGQYRLMWDSRPDTMVEGHDLSLVGNVVGCYSSDRALAPICTMYSN